MSSLGSSTADAKPRLCVFCLCAPCGSVLRLPSTKDLEGKQPVVGGGQLGGSGRRLQGDPRAGCGDQRDSNPLSFDCAWVYTSVAVLSSTQFFGECWGLNSKSWACRLLCH